MAIRRWLSGQEVIKKLDITKIDLFELCKKKALTAYCPQTCAPIPPHNLTPALFPNDGFIGPKIKLTTNGIEFLEGSIFGKTYTPADIDQCYFLKKDVEAFKHNEQSEVDKKWRQVEEIAKEMWDKDPNITIADMANSNEINSIIDRNEATIRRRIQHLCPNRQPGRRKKPHKIP